MPGAKYTTHTTRMPNTTTFQPGDRVRHPARPEWGEGRVESAHHATAHGKPGQRLVVTFANHGRVTLNTAIVAIAPANGAAPTTPAAAGGWLGSLGDACPVAQLAALPEACADPLATLAQRLSATMDLYRFAHTPRGMLDWAVAATGLSDPMSRFTREQLEQAFGRFELDRESHLKQLLFDAWRKGDDDALAAIKHHRQPDAVAAAQRVIRSLR